VGSLTNTVTGLERPLANPTVQKLGLMNDGACRLVDEALLSLFKRDHDGASAVIDASNVFVDREAEVIKSLDEVDSQTYYVLHLAMDSQRRVAEYARDIAEIVLDMTVERTLRKQEIAPPQIAFT
jgi:hypothetical protein